MSPTFTSSLLRTSVTRTFAPSRHSPAITTQRSLTLSSPITPPHPACGRPGPAVPFPPPCTTWSNKNFSSSFSTATSSGSGRKFLGGKHPIMMDLCLVPMGSVSVSKEVTAVERILRDPKWGLEVRMHAYGSNISGEWDAVMAAMQECHRALHDEHGVVRITSSIRMGTRVDKKQSIEDKIRSVEDVLAGDGS